MRSRATEESRHGPARPRRRPKQARSREIVRAIQQAGLLILEREGAEALTTNRIAEVAGVSIGSLYRYYPNKEAVVADVYEARTQSELEVFSDVDRWTQALVGMPLDEAIRWLVEVAVARERRLLELDAEFYRDNSKSFSLGRRVGHPLVQGIRCMLEARADEIDVGDLDHAAFLLARGLGGILRVSVDEQPDCLADPAFVDEVVALFRRYLTAGDPGARTPPA